MAVIEENEAIFTDSLIELTPYLHNSKFVLDYGCGNGNKTLMIRSMCKLRKEVIIIAYDPNPNEISFAKIHLNERTINNVFYVSSLNELHDLMKNYNITGFDSIISTFVLHESGMEILKDMKSLLNDNGNLIIIEHDKKGMDISQFNKILTDADKKEIREHSLAKMFKEHTKFGLDDYISFTEKYGFKVVNAYSVKKKNCVCFLIVKKK